MQTVTIEFSDDNDYEISQNILKRSDGSKFDADFFLNSKKVEPATGKFDRIIVGEGGGCSSRTTINSMSVCGSNISMSGGKNQVQMNGVSITMSGSKISLKTSKNVEVEVNGVKYLPIGGDNTTAKNEADDKGYDEIDFKAADICIDAIEISGSGGVVVRNSADTFDSSSDLAVNIKGSGDIDLADIKMESCSLNVMGSGDIKVRNTTMQNCNAQVMGSGDITFNSSCSAKRMNASVMGSGDISGGGMSVDKINKRVMGSGDISGF